MRRLKRTRAAGLLKNFVGKRVLVIGDLMLDEFLWGHARRIAPEAPVPVVEIVRESVHTGGAGNVAANLAALKAQTVIIGVKGNDSFGTRLCDEFDRLGINSEHIVIDNSRPTTVKTRIIAHSQHVVRTDREKKHPVDRVIEQHLIDRFLVSLPQADAVIVSDYEKGVITPTLLSVILPAVKKRDIPVCIDPKLKNFEYYQPATLVTPNQHEAESAARMTIDSPESLEKVGQKLRSMLGSADILITRGEEGMSLFNGDEHPTHIPTMAREVFDVTGAGDTVVATLTLGLAAGANSIEAAMLANYAAGIVVGKVGTATASPEEILNSFDTAQPPELK